MLRLPGSQQVVYWHVLRHVNTRKTDRMSKESFCLFGISESFWIQAQCSYVVNIHRGHLSENKLRRFRINESVLLSIWEISADGEEKADISWNIQEVSMKSKLCRRLIHCRRRTPRFSPGSSCCNSCCPTREDARCSDLESGKKKHVCSEMRREPMRGAVR